MQLTVRSGADAGASVTVDRRLTIGREGDFRLTDPTVSRMHAAVTPTSDGRVLLEDLGSTGGTVVNGTKLFGPVTLQGGEQILMGGSILELEAAAPPVRSAAPPAVAVGVGEVLPAAPGPPPSPPPSPVASTPVRAESGNRRTLVIAVVVALVAGAVGFVIVTGGDDDPQPGDGAGGVEALAPLANLGAQPGDFSADPSTWTVTLTWSDAPRVVGLDHYEVSRNGTTLDDAVTQTTFVDDGALPGERLDYEVVAVGSGGATEPAAVSVRAPKVAVADALVTGPWLVEMRITRSNLDDEGATTSLFWSFEPVCDFGACDGTFTIRRTDVVGASTAEAGGRYTGVGFGAFLLKDCRGETISETVDVAFAVKRASVRKGVWVAESFRGTLDEIAESPGCITARRTFAITATRA
ncbi:MAG TPA: FHA domain-containing protein [Actinomycetota bacterium]|jgi:hypothetical protein|nr:FHA domain-containing protein [Actinomycetota bacterium]